MGNSNSVTSSQVENFDNIIDYIASYYILTMDFKNLTKLSEKDYCDKLIILTSSILERYLTEQEIVYLDQRTQNGIEVNNMSKDKIIYLTKEQFEGFDVKNDVKKNLKKKRVCIGIAKFYIIIAHIFSAIVMTVNPIYNYTDEYGNNIESNLFNKDRIPKGSVKRVSKINICNNRINALQTGQLSTNEINVSPKVCDMNLNNDKSLKTLNNEPGIPELKMLYLDDDYDYSTGQFKGMSEITRKEFEHDLTNFYKVFTGNETMPENIKDFSDIKLKDYSNSPGCKNDSLKNKYTGSLKNDLFKNYANNIKTMIQNANLKQYKLLEIINVLFTFVDDPHTKTKKIRINPLLSSQLLEETVKKTRHLIIDLYLTCEKDYIKGIQLYEAIINKIGFNAINRQTQTLENKIIELIHTDNENEINKPGQFNEVRYINQNIAPIENGNR